MIINVEKNFTNFDTKKVKWTEKDVNIKIIKTPLISSIVYLKNTNIKRYILDKLLFLIIFGEIFFTIFYIKNVKSLLKTCLY